jgi:hypothetical protein
VHARTHSSHTGHAREHVFCTFFCLRLPLVRTALVRYWVELPACGNNNRIHHPSRVSLSLTCATRAVWDTTQLDLIASNQWQYGALMAASRAPSRIMRAYRSEGSVREVVRAHGLVLKASARCTRGPSAS